MHHHGEDAVSVEVSSSGFGIELQSHVSGATVTISGPIHGVFENPNHAMDQNAAIRLGEEIAHTMRRATGEAPLRAT
jgi:hypothetical protein